MYEVDYEGSVELGVPTGLYNGNGPRMHWCIGALLGVHQCNNAAMLPDSEVTWCPSPWLFFQVPIGTTLSWQVAG